jgi:hypothetical protein
MDSSAPEQPWSSVFSEYYINHVYRTEDALYQILFDKAHRPDVYKHKL